MFENKLCEICTQWLFLLALPLFYIMYIVVVLLIVLKIDTDLFVISYQKILYRNLMLRMKVLMRYALFC